LKGYQTVKLEEIKDGILCVTLSRPNQLNAINPEMIDELCSVATHIRSADRYKAVILKGAGKAFSSGGDLRSFEKVFNLGKDEIESFIAKFLRFSKIWYDLPVPTIACLHGAASGGGASLALACDIRIAAPSTKLQFVFSKIGLIPDMGAHYFLPKIIGEAKALEVLYLGNPIHTDEALRMGLIHQVCDEADLEEVVLRYASQFKHTSTTSNKIIKMLVKRSSHASLDEILNEETYYQTECFKTEEFQGYIKRFFVGK
jgi:2-(1,2-epoxy-1,2-dihydrophenyl)acetyl-CoA isomerase